MLFDHASHSVMPRELTALYELRTAIAQWRQAGERIALVPTMGALHAGHMALVEAARKRASRVVVSIFVNPTQFGPTEDFNRYPRPLAEDLALLRTANVDAVWLPAVATMYPDGFATTVHVTGISEPLEGTFRPGHFDGVATVVAKLFHQAMPDVALFGEKDYQQLCVIRRMVQDLDLLTEIIAVPTLREADGLAMSSRNRYLNAQERVAAAQLYATLRYVAQTLRNGADLSETLAEGVARLQRAGFSRIDYLDLRAEDTLVPLSHYQPSSRLLAAAWLGSTRLIDTIMTSVDHAE